jgi:hypothetical protein
MSGGAKRIDPNGGLLSLSKDTSPGWVMEIADHPGHGCAREYSCLVLGIFRLDRPAVPASSEGAA